MLKKIKKYLFIGCLSTLCICILMLMATLIARWIFDVGLFKIDAYVRILVCSAILCVDCFFNNTALAVIKKTKILSWISIILLNIATLLGLIIFIGLNLDTVPGWYGRTVGIFAITAAFFTVIIGTNGKLGDHVKGLKFVYFGLMVFIDLVIIGCIISDKLNLFKKLDWFVFPFVLICIAAFALMCVTSIMGRHFKDEMVDNVIDNSSEIDELKKEIERLTLENNQLKAQLEELQNKEA